MSSLGVKAARKIKRIGKNAVQFRFTSTFEYIDVHCNGTWRPDNLRIVWLRSHRRVQSIDVKWEPTEDRGPNGAEGRAKFDPPLSVSLLVTLYRETNETEFDEKTYKYYIENDGPAGKKILASFTCDVAEYAGVPTTRHKLDMTFKTVSKKVNKAILGITLESEYIKQGNSSDIDMQSTFSAISAGNSSLNDEEEEEGEGGADGSPHSSSKSPSTGHRLSKVTEEDEIPLASMVTLGTGQTLKRGTLPYSPPNKPPRTGSIKKSHSTESARSGHEETQANPLENGEEASAANVTTSEPPQSSTLSLPVENQKPPAFSVPQPPSVTAPPAGSTTPEEKVATTTTAQVPDRDHLSPTTAPDIIFSNSLGEPITESISMESPPATEDGSEEIEALLTAQKSFVGKGVFPKAPVKNDVNKAMDSSPASAEVNEPPSKEVEYSSGGGEVGRSNSIPQGGSPPNQAGSNTGDTSAEVKKEEEGDVKSNLVEVTAIPEATEASVEVAGASIEVAVVGSDMASQVEEEGAVISNGIQSHRDDDEMSESSRLNSGTAEAPPTSETPPTVEAPPNGEPNAGEEIKPLTNGVANSHEDDGFLSNFSSVNNFMFETAGMLAEMQRRETAREMSSSPPSRELAPLIEEHKTNGAMANGSTPSAAVATGTMAWLGEASFVDCFGESVTREKLETADIIGLYFSANWCPPCRRFLPKLIKFYHHLKQHNKSFEILYISSDYSKQDMMKYMHDQQMPWVGLAYDSSVADKLRGDFSVSAIPLFTIITRNGIKIEASGKKPVEAASNGAAVLKLYNKWHERLEEEGGVPHVPGEASVAVESKEKKGLFKKVKDAIGGGSSSSKSSGKDDKNEPGGPPAAPESSESESHPETKREQSRQVVEGRQRVKSKLKVTLTEEMMEEKEDRIRYLEEVNASLKQTNDDLNEELAEMRKQFADAASKLQQLEVSSRQLEEERRELMANLNIRGWLLKRGVKGPTANVWRRRYFRCDQGSKIYYYKSASEGTPQGMVDLDKVVSVQEVSPAQQDKNHATFLVQCDGRTFQLQAIDEATMRKWMSAIEYLRNWRKRNAEAP